MTEDGLTRLKMLCLELYCNGFILCGRPVTEDFVKLMCPLVMDRRVLFWESEQEFMNADPTKTKAQALAFVHVKQNGAKKQYAANEFTAFFIKRLDKAKLSFCYYVAE
jgi:hypothetical protein